MPACSCCLPEAWSERPALFLAPAATALTMGPSLDDVSNAARTIELPPCLAVAPRFGEHTVIFSLLAADRELNAITIVFVC
jgi:hypothetical protein